uniref:Sterol uptake control protein 2 n=1 Tax=Talaromyces marneffei PM1 TaxID=1077442 RepID=A0A093UKU9_TALMA
MSKRPHEDSVFSKTANFLERSASTPGNSISINELLSNSEEAEADHSETHARKPRNFIASVACENCRLKKTRCDESRPKCGLCKALNLECVYSERKLSKKDQSIGMIISTLHRIETKLENLPSVISNDIRPITGHVLQAVEAIQASASTTAAGTPSARTSSHKFSLSQNTSPAATNLLEAETQGSADGKEIISFSQHGVVVWPGIIERLPHDFLSVYEQIGRNYVLDVELERPPLPMWVNSPFGLPNTGNWLEELPFALVKGLCEAFFSLFHPFTPFMDKHFFFSLTLGTVIKHGFSTTIETCLVLNVMALGCLAVRAYEEADFPLPGTMGDHFERPAWFEAVLEDPPGLSFFNEARKRMGFLMEKNNLSSCQYYLLSAMYYTQIIRPLDSGAMLNRAATCLCFMLANRDINYNEWEGDMKSRVFWNTVMYETILVQELDLPPSGLLSLEDNVPIPKFIPFKLSSEITRLPDPDESYYHQSESGNLPRPAVSIELHKQVEEWRKNLPSVIQFSEKNSDTTLNDDRSPSISGTPRTPTSLAVLVADSMLRARYRICKFHIGRPYLYKALRTPNLLTDEDYEQIRSGLRFAMDWPMIRGVFRLMRSCIPIRFAFCSQFFGQLLIFHGIANSDEPRLRATLPPGWERWYDEMVEFLEYCSAYSPAISRDMDLVRLL